MRTEEDLRQALAGLAGGFTDAPAVLAGVRRRVTAGRRRRAAVKAGGVLAAAATAAAIVMTTLPGRAAPAYGLSSARGILLTAAVSAARQPASGTYWHSSVLYDFLRPGKAGSNGTVIASDLVKTWVSSSPSHRSWGSQRWLKGSVTLAAGITSKHVKGSNFSYSDPAQSFTVFFMTVGELAHLPASPSRLAAALRQAARWWIRPPASATYVDSILFQFAFDLLRSPISPQVRAAAFRVLAQLPGVTSVGRIRDSRGRLGYAIQMSRPAFPGHNKYTDQYRFTDTLVVDPRTGIALENISTGATVAEDETLISQGWTNRGPGLPCATNAGGPACLGNSQP